MCVTMTCSICQQNEWWGKGCGHLPQRMALNAIGWGSHWFDWSLDLQIQQMEVEFVALTCIDLLTNMLELIQIWYKNSSPLGPTTCKLLAVQMLGTTNAQDNGGEFMGVTLTTTWTTWDHQWTKNFMQSSCQWHSLSAWAKQLPTDCELHWLWNQQWTSIKPSKWLTMLLQLQYILPDVQSWGHLGVACRALVFQRDMFLEMPSSAHLNAIQQRRQTLIDKHPCRQNQQRWDVSTSLEMKWSSWLKAHGPCSFAQECTTELVGINNNPHVSKTINISCSVPFKHLWIAKVLITRDCCEQPVMEAKSASSLSLLNERAPTHHWGSKITCEREDHFVNICGNGLCKPSRVGEGPSKQQSLSDPHSNLSTALLLLYLEIESWNDWNTGWTGDVQVELHVVGPFQKLTLVGAKTIADYNLTDNNAATGN